jgi:hypothetical protein
MDFVAAFGFAGAVDSNTAFGYFGFGTDLVVALAYNSLKCTVDSKSNIRLQKILVCFCTRNTFCTHFSQYDLFSRYEVNSKNWFRKMRWI